MRSVPARWLLLLASALLVALAVGCGGGSDVPSATLLYTLDTPNPQTLGEFGYALSLSDVDGDGKAEIAVGVPFEDVGDNPAQGRAYLFSGATGVLILTFDNPEPDAGIFFAWTVAMGDVDGDGRAEIAVSATREDASGGASQGRAHVFSGATGELLDTFDNPNPEIYAQFGNSAAFGDYNGDGTADRALGDPFGDVDGLVAGEVLVLSSGRTDILTAPVPQADAEFGYSAAMADIDGDGEAEVVVGARLEDVDGNVNQGRVYVFSGGTGELLYTLDTPNPEPDAWFGAAVAMGDMDGDGWADIAVAARLEDVGDNETQGRVYVFSGATGELILTIDSPNPQAENGEFGFGLAMGDVDGDGRAEVVVGAPSEDVGDVTAQGRVYVFAFP
ncbi:MAG: FG-GAP repeat protein [Chloroflexi bacterium]|nr:FG-GAP repeat protein [Chloroflexota bacterium]